MPTFRNKKVDVVIDVRSRVEFFFGHLSGAVCMPVSDLDTTIVARPEISRDASILVYCASGARSAIASATLKRMGYRRVVDGGPMAQARASYDQR
jgi:phage shock protein E